MNVHVKDETAGGGGVGSRSSRHQLGKAGSVLLIAGLALTSLSLAPQTAHAQALDVKASDWYGNSKLLLADVPAESIYLPSPNLKKAKLVDNGGGNYELIDDTTTYWQGGSRIIKYVGDSKSGIINTYFTLKWTGIGETADGEKLDLELKCTCVDADVSDAAWSTEKTGRAGDPKDWTWNRISRTVMEDYNNMVCVNCEPFYKKYRFAIKILKTGTDTLASGTYLLNWLDLDTIHDGTVESITLNSGASDLGKAYVCPKDERMISYDEDAGKFYAKKDDNDDDTLCSGVVIPLKSSASFTYVGNACGCDILRSYPKFNVNTKVYVRANGADTLIGKDALIPGTTAKGSSVPVDIKDASRTRINDQTALWKNDMGFNYVIPAGYKLVSAKQDGKENSTAVANKTYTFSTIREDHTQVLVLQAISPDIQVKKTVDKSVLNVGDSATYTLDMWQATADTFVNNATIKDTLPSPLTGSMFNTAAAVVKYQGTQIPANISVSGNTLTVATNQTLNYNEHLTVTIPVTFGNKTSKELAGTHTNTMEGSGTSIDGNTLSKTATAQVQVIIPVLRTDKSAAKSVVNTSESNHYAVKATNTGPDGAIAYNVVIDDNLSSASAAGDAYIVPSSIVVKNAAGTKIDNAVVKWNGDAGKPTGYSVATNANLNPNEFITVEYDVIAGEKTSTQLIATGIDNTATSIADNANRSPEAKVHVSLYEPKLVVDKSSVEQIVNLSEIINYTVKVNQTTSGAIAWNVDVDDSLAADTITAGAFINMGTIKVVDPKLGDITDKCTITYKGENAAKPTGYKVETPCNLETGEPLVITYTATAGEILDVDLIDSKVKNQAYADSDNTPPTPPDDNIVDIYVPAVDMTKDAAVEQANCGDEVDYVITMRQVVPNAIARQVDFLDTIRDASAAAGARIKVDTIRIYDVEGNDVTADCQITPTYAVPDMPADLTDDDIVGTWVFSVKSQTESASGEFVFAADKTFTKKLSGKLIIDGEEKTVDVNENGAWALDSSTGELALSFKSETEPRTDVVKISSSSVQNKMFFKQDGTVFSKDMVKSSNDASSDSASDDTDDESAGQTEETDPNLATAVLVETPIDLRYDEIATMTYTMKYGNDDSVKLIKTNVENDVVGFALPNKPSTPADEIVPLYKPALNLVKTSDRQVISAGDSVHYELTATQTVEGAIAKNLSFTDTFKFNGPALDCAAINSSIKVVVDGAEVPEAVIETDVVSAPDEKDPSATRYTLTANTDIDIDSTQTAVLSYDVRFTDGLQYVTPQEVINEATVSASNADPADDDNIIKIVDPDFSIEKTVNAQMINSPEPVAFNIHAVEIVPDTTARHTVFKDTLDEQGIRCGLSINHDIKVALNGTDITPACVISYVDNGGQVTGFEVMIEQDIVYNDAIDISYTCSTENLNTGGRIAPILNTVSVKAANMLVERSAECPVNLSDNASLLKAGDLVAKVLTVGVAGIALAAAAAFTLTMTRRRARR